MERRLIACLVKVLIRKADIIRRIISYALFESTQRETLDQEQMFPMQFT